VIACVNTTLFGRAILDEGKQSLTAFDTWNRLNDECSVVEGGDGLFEAAQWLRDVDVHLHDEVDAVATERRVFLLVQNDDDVAGFKTGFLKFYE